VGFIALLSLRPANIRGGEAIFQIKEKLMSSGAKQTNNSASPGKSSIVIYRAKDGKINLDVKFERDTLWLTQKQIAYLFGTQRPAITKHLSNIFKSGELREESVGSILEHTASDGKKYNTRFYNLDAVISVGYRVNSRRATQFRIWATKTLKDYLIQGYAINQKRLSQQSEKFKELQDTIRFIRDKSGRSELSGRAQELLNIINEYSSSLTILHQYDKGTLASPRIKKPQFKLYYENSQQLIRQIKSDLLKKGEATSYFGQETGSKLKSIIGAVYQTFDRKELYAGVAGKAANLLYLIIKDHPFVDGNKRIGSLLFIYFLEKNRYLRRESGTRKIENNTMVALALLVANSQPREKDIMIKIISNLLKD